MQRLSLHGRALLLLLAATLLFSWSISNAQDAETTGEPQSQDEQIEDTVETPTDAPTDAPTDVPTDVPTDIPTIAPTDVTPEVTETVLPTEPTLETTTPTDAPTDVPTEVTPSEPLPEEPLLRPLFVDTFDGDLSAWRVGAGWSLVPSEGGQALLLSEPIGLIQYTVAPLEDVAIQARFLSASGALQLIARQSEEGSVSASLSADGRLELAKNGQVVQSMSLAAAEDDQWRTLRLSVVDGVLRVSVDGVELLGVLDESSLPAGAISLGGSQPLLVDDVIISIAEDEDLPTPTETETEPAAPPVEQTPTATETEPAPEATAEPAVEATPDITPETPQPTDPVDDGRVIITPEIVTFESTQAVAPAEPVDDGLVVAMAVPAGLVSPINNAYVTTTRPTFTWTPYQPDGATVQYYQIQVATDTRFRNNRVVYNSADNSATFTVPANGTALSQGLKYWRVRPRLSNATWGSWSPREDFTVDSRAPRLPSLTSATSALCNAATTDTTPTFAWNSVAGVYRYELALDMVNPPVVVAARTTATSYTPPPLLYNANETPYWWRLRAVDQAGNASAWTTLCSLDINSARNAAPVLNRNESANVTLTWTPISWATSYRVEVATSTSFSTSTRVHRGTYSGVQQAVVGPLANGTFYWRVQARRTDGTWGGWSSVGTFTVEVAAP